MMTQLEDERFDEAEAEINRGEPWRFRDADAPNPLTILATAWSQGHTKHGEAEFLNGVDRTGGAWSVLVGSLVLRRRLVDGEVTEWDDDRKAFVVAATEGRVQPGEVVSIKYLGDKESASGKSYPDFTVVRKPAAAGTSKDDEAATAGGDDVPF
jgi:hypothetical protein